MAANTSKIQITVAYSGSANGSITGQINDSGNNLAIGDTTFPAASTNVSMTLAFTLANLQQAVFRADQNCTIKTNSSSAPQETITLIAGQPKYYSASQATGTMTFAGNVTTAFVTCTPATRVQTEVLQS